MITLFESTDYVIYNRIDDTLATDSKGKIIIYGDLKEAQEDRHDEEFVIPCNTLPAKYYNQLTNQILADNKINYAKNI
jgi:hypothetical protein